MKSFRDYLVTEAKGKGRYEVHGHSLYRIDRKMLERVIDKAPKAVFDDSYGSGVIQYDGESYYTYIGWAVTNRLSTEFAKVVDVEDFNSSREYNKAFENATSTSMDNISLRADI